MTITPRRLLLPLIIALVPLAACDTSEEAMENRIEEMAREHGVDMDIDLDAEDGAVTSMTMQGEDGETTTAYGANISMPEDFPDDVTIYPGLELFSTTKMPTGHLVQGHTDASRDEVIAFYKDKLPGEGWELEASTDNPVMHMLQYRKESRTLNVGIMPGDRTTVSLTSLAQPAS